MIEALAKGDADEVERLVRKHVETSRRRVLPRLRRVVALREADVSAKCLHLRVKLGSLSSVLNARPCRCQHVSRLKFDHKNEDPLHFYLAGRQPLPLEDLLSDHAQVIVRQVGAAIIERPAIQHADLEGNLQPQLICKLLLAESKHVVSP